jgi:hypothetical protein
MRAGRLLPDLLTVAVPDIARVTIERGSERLAFERRDKWPGRWQMVEPKDVAAEPMRLETLVRTLKDLPRSVDSGTITGDAAAYGLDAPAAKVELWGNPAQTSGEPARLLGTLEAGKVIRGTRYVRPDHRPWFDTVDAKLLAALDLPLDDWREHVVLGVATFEVVSVAIKHEDQLIRAERSRRGQWKLTSPVKTPANPAKVESLLAALSALRVVTGSDGYVADDVKDFGPYGLAPPTVTVELTTTREGAPLRVLEVGKPVPGHSDRVFVRQGNQNDVVAVEAKALSEVPESSVTLRSQQVMDIEPAAVSRVEVAASGITFSMQKEAAGWELKEPRKEKADARSIQSFLAQLAALKTSEFLEPKRLRDAGLNPPLSSIKVWERAHEESSAVLYVGRYDLLRKTVYAQLPLDQVVLALPDTVVDVLPKNKWAFRDRTVVALSPAAIRKLAISRPGLTTELEPATTGAPNQWRMRHPVDAPADVATITRALAVLAGLRAEDFVTDQLGDVARFGLDRPARTVTWTTDQAHTLKIGNVVPKTANHYALLDGQALVFTLSAEVLSFFDAEFHDHIVSTFPAGTAERVILRWHNRAVALRRHVPSPGRSTWVEEPGSDTAGLDLSRTEAIVIAMSRLETNRFLQYDGPIPASTGLLRPRLTVEVETGAKDLPHVLRIGYANPDGQVFAATGTSASGPVFLLPAPAWNALYHSGERLVPLPVNVFAPAT